MEANLGERRVAAQMIAQFGAILILYNLRYKVMKPGITAIAFKATAAIIWDF